jgi:ABC-type sugar transport system substrate-binding protein
MRASVKRVTRALVTIGAAAALTAGVAAGGDDEGSRSSGGGGGGDEEVTVGQITKTESNPFFG